MDNEIRTAPETKNAEHKDHRERAFLLIDKIINGDAEAIGVFVDQLASQPRAVSALVNIAAENPPGCPLLRLQTIVKTLTLDATSTN